MDATVSKRRSIDKDLVKAAAAGRWLELLERLGIPGESLDGGHHPCPKCGGVDRFRLVDETSGAVLCGQCFNTKNGDGIAAAGWMLGVDFRGSLEWLADAVGLVDGAGTTSSISGDPVDAMARLKGCSAESLRLYGATATADGAGVAFPAYPAGIGPDPLLPAAADSGATSGETIPGIAAGEKVDGRPSGESPDLPRVGTFTVWPQSQHDKPRKGLFGKGDRAGVFLPHNDGGVVRLPVPGERWVVLEGVKDSAKAADLGLLAVGLPSSRIPRDCVDLLKGVDVVIVPDRDDAGDDGAAASAKLLHGTARSVRIAELPVPFKDKGGDDLRDAVRKRGIGPVLESIERAELWSPPPERLRDVIRTDKLDEQVDLLIGSLCARKLLFRFGGRLVTVVDGVINPLNRHALRVLASRVSRLIPGDREVQWPDAVLESVLHHPDGWPDVPELAGVVCGPCVVRGGRILTRAGYDARSRLWVSRDLPREACGEAVEGRDKARELAAAVLDELTCDFPFKHEAGRAAYLAWLLTAVGRYSFDGPVPLVVVSANTPRVGKGKLAMMLSMVAQGRPMASTPASTPEELRKQVTAVLLEGSAVRLLDNLPSGAAVGNPILDSLITSTTWSDRILGQSTMTRELPCRTLWCVNGNNVTLAADTAPRTLLIELSSDDEHPELRDGFRHTDLVAFVTENRDRLAWMVCSILSAFLRSGDAPEKIPAWGSFESWSSVIRQAVVWLGLPDPADTRVEVPDTEKDFINRVLTAWEQMDPAGQGRLLQDVLAEDDPDGRVLREVLLETVGRLDPKVVGNRLKTIRGRNVGGRKLDLERRSSDNRNIWRVISVDKNTTRKDGFSPVSANGPDTGDTGADTGNGLGGGGKATTTSRADHTPITHDPPVGGGGEVAPVSPVSPGVQIPAQIPEKNSVQSGRDNAVFPEFSGGGVHYLGSAPVSPVSPVSKSHPGSRADSAEGVPGGVLGECALRIRTDLETDTGDTGDTGGLLNKSGGSVRDDTKTDDPSLWGAIRVRCDIILADLGGGESSKVGPILDGFNADELEYWLRSVERRRLGGGALSSLAGAGVTDVLRRRGGDGSPG